MAQGNRGDGVSGLIGPDESVRLKAEDPQSNVVIVLQVLDDLGGAEGYVDIEKVALRAYELAPDRFSWRTTPLPSWERVRTAFVHANQRARRQGLAPLAVSNKSGDAWRLTSEGLLWSRATPRAPSFTGKRSGKSLARVRDLRRHRVFMRYLHGTPVSEFERFELADLLICPPDSSGDVVLRKLDAARAAAADLGDQELRQFLDAIGSEVGNKWT
jgi:hypothetical protein